MVQLHLIAYVTPAAFKAVGTSRCLWAEQAIRSLDPRSGT